MEKYNDVKFFLFFLVLLGFVVGGYILMHDSIRFVEKESVPNNPKEEIKDIRLDSTKDYIYFTDYNLVANELDIAYQTINLNFKDYDGVASNLNQESKNFNQNLIYDDNNNLISAEYMIYQVYSYDKYISLVVNYYTYDVEDLISYKKSDTYIFNKYDGKQYSESELLNEFNLTKDDALEKIEVHIEDENIAKENEELDVVGTINNIGNMAIYVDKIGRLSISVLVKSDQKDYNEVIVLS